MVIPCRRENYGGKRERTRYIVVHYTAGDGDTARDNGLYFASHGVGASAHWFVDQREAVASVPEEMTAWHCGDVTYVHPHCRNGNSVAVELCSRVVDGKFTFDRQTLTNGAALVRKLMERYGIPRERVLRHYDVTGKQCPAPLVDAGEWEAFLEMLVRYETVEELPDWARPTVEKLLDKGWLTGDGRGLALSQELVRVLVILDRAGIWSEDCQKTMPQTSATE